MVDPEAKGEASSVYPEAGEEHMGVATVLSFEISVITHTKTSLFRVKNARSFNQGPLPLSFDKYFLAIFSSFLDTV